MTEQLQYLDSLNSKSTVFLIRQLSTGRILTGRRISQEQKEIYDKLLRKKISHVPYIRKIIPEADGQFLVLQDYIQGVTLEKMLEEQPGVSYADAARIGVQLCYALERLHDFGIIHRDIKPSNVMITADKEAYLIDFDIARTHKENQNADTAILGTKGYAAPEQFGFQQTDARTDIYAVGVLLNQLCTGKFPHEELAEPPLDKIIQKCISIDPSKRYPSASVVRKALEAEYPQAEATDAPECGEPPREVRHGVPGFRSGNPFHILVATLGYGVFAVLVAAILSAAFGSVADFVIGFILVAAPVVCYLFVFDIFSVRSKCWIVEKYRHSSRYSFYCACVMISWLVFCFVFMFIGVGVLVPIFGK